MRAVSVPFSPARPSRLKNEPGIFPAAYMRSSTSTVRGRKSVSRRFPAVAVARTIVSPWRTTTAPPACFAIRPVSNEISLPAISTESRVRALLLMVLPSCPPFGRRSLLVFSLEPNTLMLPGQAGYQLGVGDTGQHFAVVQERRRLRDTRPHAGPRVPRHPGRDLLLAPLALESIEIEPECGRVRPQVRIVTAPRIGEQRIVELPEASLARR